GGLDEAEDLGRHRQVVFYHAHALRKVLEAFRLAASGADEREMYQVFNMGIRLEVYTSEQAAETIIAAARHFGIEGRVIGRVEESVKKELSIHVGGQEIRY
ncbi:MAG: hypothetical protein EOO11_12310, partial [Chitinophagaceae bacterium]